MGLLEGSFAAEVQFATVHPPQSAPVTARTDPIDTCHTAGLRTTVVTREVTTGTEAGEAGTETMTATATGILAVGGTIDIVGVTGTETAIVIALWKPIEHETIRRRRSRS